MNVSDLRYLGLGMIIAFTAFAWAYTAVGVSTRHPFAPMASTAEARDCPAP